MRFFISLVAAIAVLPSTQALWPQPATFKNGSSVVWIDPDKVAFDTQGFGKTTGAARASKRYDRRVRVPPLRLSRSSAEPHDPVIFSRSANASSAPSDADLLHAAYDRFFETLIDGAYVAWKFYPRGADFEPSYNGSGPSVTRITILKESCDANTNATHLDESYALDLAANGSVLIQAANPQGAMYGLTTLAQLFCATDDGHLYTDLAPVSVRDKPSYAHRGLNMDIARNYESPATVKHLLKAMALSKFNRLHLHATDAQSWPLDIPSMPELAAKGRYRPSLVWSADDLKSVQEYARWRGIQTIVEIDAPGHTSSIAYSHSELVVAFNQQPWNDYCAEPPCGQVSLKNNATLAFFDKLYGDLLPRVKPFAGYFHTGADEINRKAYLLDPEVRSNETAVLTPLLDSFVKNLHDDVRKQGLQPLVWEELITEWNLTLPIDVLVQTWLNSTSLDTVTKRGYRALFGDNNHWYLSCGYGQYVEPTAKSATADAQTGFVDYCSPMQNWRVVYSYDPTANLTQQQAALLEGGEVHMWGELTTAANLDGKVWPRAAAAAEVLWSGPKGVKGLTEEVTRRLADLRERLVGLGIAASAIQTEWCLQNPGSCSL